MIKIEIDDVEFEMKLTTNQDRCDYCAAQELCSSGGRIGAMCGKPEYDNMLVCVSVSKVGPGKSEEPKVYGPHNILDCKGLTGEIVECWLEDKGKWGKGKLLSRAQDGNPYCVDGYGWKSLIRELPLRHLSWSEVKKLHPELNDVVLKDAPVAPEEKPAPRPYDARKETLKLMKRLRKKGAKYKEISEELNERAIPTFSGKGKWHAQTVHRLVMEG